MKVWFHAASVGEVNALKPLIDTFSSRGHEYIITTYTRTGAKHAGDIYPESKVIKYPFVDNPLFVSRLIRTHRPDMLVIAETELWPFLIGESRKHGLEVFIVNGRISDRTFRRYFRFRWLFGKILKNVSRIYAKSDKHRRRFLLLGAKDVKFMGDLKVDAVMKATKIVPREELGFSREDILITFGSIRKREIPHILSAIGRMKGLARFIVAPRHLENVPYLKKRLMEEGFNVSTRTAPQTGSDVLILDTLGELRSIYGLSDMAFVGGTLENYGGHNILEPLYFGIPTIVGKYHWNVREQVEYFRRRRAIFTVEDWMELVETFRFLLKNPSIARHIKEVSQEFFRTYGNAATRIYGDIMSYMKRGESPPT